MTVPALGFGTAPILGRLSRREGLRALGLAYDLGVRWFDTARSYGWGETEGVLGEFLAGGRRDGSVVVTKCGILPQRRSPLLSAAKSGARGLLRVLPASRRLVTRAASAAAFQPTRSCDAVVLRGSVEASLRALRMPYVDVLLLHTDAPEPGLEAVVELFQRLQAEGKTRRWGFSLEGDLAAGLARLEAAGALDGAVIQTPVTEQLLGLAPAWPVAAFVAHSPFRAPPIPANFGVSPLRAVLGALSHDVRCEALVTSMFTPAHIEANVRDRALEAAAAA